MQSNSSQREDAFRNVRKEHSLNATLRHILVPMVALALSSVASSGFAAVLDPVYKVTGYSPFLANCDGAAANGTLYINSEADAQVAVNPTNTNNVVGVWEQDVWSTGGARGVVSGASFDGGKTWTLKPLPLSRCGGGNATIGGNYPRASDPWVSFGPTGIVHAISDSFDPAAPNAAVLASHSLDGGSTWSNPARVQSLPGANGIPDFQASITADPTDANMVYVGMNAGPFDAEVWRSADGGNTWNGILLFAAPNQYEQLVGSRIVVVPDGTVVALVTYIQFDRNGSGAVLYEVAKAYRSTDKGKTWSAPLRVSQFQTVGASDPETGAAVRGGAGLPEIAVGPNGVIYAVWADGRFSGGAHDAIAMVRSGDGGLTWTAPVAINSNLAVEAFEPSIHVRPDHTIAVTYFDFRNNTSDPTTLPTTLWLTQSTDATTWTEKGAIAGPFDLDFAPDVNGRSIGDYQGLSSMGNVSEPFYVITRSTLPHNLTDVYSAPVVSTAAMLDLMTKAPVTVAKPAPDVPMSDAFRKKVSDHLRRLMERRGLAMPNPAGR